MGDYCAAVLNNVKWTSFAPPGWTNFAPPLTDLIVGSNNSYIATLVERHSRFVMLAKVANKDTQSIIPALIQAGA